MTREQENGIGRNPEHPSGVEVKSIAAEYHPTENQDAYFILPGQKAFGVFDGVGGGKGGKEAAESARRHVLDTLPQLSANASVEIIKRFLNTLLVDASNKLAEEPDSGFTTASVALVVQEGRKKKLVVGNVGDSRVYLFHKNKKLEQLTIDDHIRFWFKNETEARKAQEDLSLVVDPGMLSPQLKDMFATRNIAGQALGQPGKVEPFVSDFKLSEGDKILITSDGVHDNLTASEIGDVFRNRAYYDTVTENLIRRAKSISTKGVPRSKQDDMTALVVDVDLLFAKGSKPKPSEVPSGVGVEQPVQSVASSQEAQVVLQSEARPEPPARAPVSGLKQRLKDGPKATQILVNEKAREYRDKKRREEEKERQELKRAQKGKDRRKLLKLGVTTVIGTAIGISGGLASWAVADATKESSMEIKTPYGKFYPFYENDFSVEKVQAKLDFFFVGRSMEKAQYEASPAELILSSNISAALLERLAQNNIQVVFASGPKQDSYFKLASYLMGHKMLTLAYVGNKNTNREMNTGYLVKEDRTGIETILSLGLDKAKQELLTYSKEILSQAVEASGGLENLCTIRVLKLPKDFKASDLTDESRKKLIGEFRPNGNPFGSADLYRELQKILNK